MKKFEEEVKGKAATMATQPGCSMTRKVWYKADDIHELSEGWVSPEDHQNTVASNKAYEKSNLVLSKENVKFVIENIELEKQIAELKSQLEKQQPEIPEELADWIESYVDIKEIAIQFVLEDFVETDIYTKIRENVEKYGAYDVLLFNAIHHGYTVAKEKRFYLKNKLTSLYLTLNMEANKYYEHHQDSAFKNQEGWKYKFTQQEIDSMAAESYERIEVEE